MSETGIIIVVVALSGLLVGGYVGFVFGWYRGRRKLIEWHTRNEEIARKAAQDPQVQAALDER